MKLSLLIHDCIVFCHSLSHTGIKLRQSVEAVAVGCETIDCDRLHHRRLVGRKKCTILQLADTLIDQINSHIFLSAVAPLLENKLRTDGRVQLQGLFGLRIAQS